MLRLFSSVALFAAIVFTNCTAARLYDFSLKDTLSIFFLNDEKSSYFCIPVQYMGEYQINDFKFDSGYIKIGDYEIPLNREELNIYTYFGVSDEEWNHHYIFIERHLSNGEMKKIIEEYEKGNVSSSVYIGYDLIIDNEPVPGNGMYDDFELYNGTAFDPALYPQNLDFFRAKYLYTFTN
jgi:hypothetical protein